MDGMIAKHATRTPRRRGRPSAGPVVSAPLPVSTLCSVWLVLAGSAGVPFDADSFPRSGLLLVLSVLEIVDGQLRQNAPVQQRQEALGDSIASLASTDAASSLSRSPAGSALQQVPVDRELLGVRREEPSQSQAPPHERGIEAGEPAVSQQIPVASESVDASLPSREATTETSGGDEAADLSTVDEQSSIPFSASGAEEGGRDALSVSEGGTALSGNAGAASPAMVPALDRAAPPAMVPDKDDSEPAPERQGSRHQTEVDAVPCAWVGSVHLGASRSQRNGVTASDQGVRRRSRTCNRLCRASSRGCR